MIINEYGSRLAVRLQKPEKEVSEYVYRETDDVINNFLTTRTLTEWRLISRINDWRNEHNFRNSILSEETLFYFNFILDLQGLVLSEGHRKKYLNSWKTYTQYNVVLKQRLVASILSTVVNSTNSIAQGKCVYDFRFGTEKEFENLLMTLQKDLFTSDNRDALMNFLAESKNRSICNTFQLTKSFNEYIYKCNSSINQTWRKNITQLRETVTQNQFALFDLLQTKNDASLSTSVLLFCLHLILLAMLALCSYGVAGLLRKEHVLLSLITDWSSQLQIRVDEQRESTNSILSRVCHSLALFCTERGCCRVNKVQQ